MTIIRTKTEDEQLLEKSTFLDDYDLIMQPDGSYVVSAIKSGVRVCWCCGEPFDAEVQKLRPIQKKNDNQGTPYLIHHKCFDHQPRPFSDMMKISKGLGMRRQLANAFKGTRKIFGV